MLEFAAYVFENIDFLSKIFCELYVKKKGLSNAQFRNEIASELCIRLDSTCLFYTRGTKYTCFCNYVLFLYVST